MARRNETKSITLADVAQVAGVAPMTVSRFLNGHPNISEKTARKVNDAVKKLGYQPNLAARMLMGRPSNAIGLIVPDLADPFYAELAHHVQEIAREHGFLVWVAASNSQYETESELLNTMRQHRVDGVLLVSSAGTHALHLPDNLPIVLLDRPIPKRSYDVVLTENRVSSKHAVEHLIEHGYQEIVCLSVDPLNVYTTAERIHGYEEAMRAHHLKPEVVPNLREIAAVQKYLQDARQRAVPPQAIFTTNNVTTIHMLEAIEPLGIRIPEDIALIGFDDFELAPILRPSLTVVRQSPAEIGRQGARILFERLRATEVGEPIQKLLPTTLIIRRSCGCNTTTH